MKTAYPSPAPAAANQFSLIEMFEYVTICSILAALSGIIGIGASLLLMLLTLAIWLRAGSIAMVLLLFVLLAADSPSSPMSSLAEYGHAPLAGLFAFNIALWYGMRRRGR